MKSRRATTLIVPFVIGLGLGAGSCSSTRPASTNSSIATNSAESRVSTTIRGPLFEVTAAWKTKKVILKTSTSASPADSFTATPRAGVSFVAVELVLHRDNSNSPVPAAMWAGTTLLDSATNRHRPIFSYPSTMVKYAPEGDSIEYVGSKQANGGDLIIRTLSESGGKLVVVFEAPERDTQFKLEIADAAPLQVIVKDK